MNHGSTVVPFVNFGEQAYASMARTATPTAYKITNPSGRGCIVRINVTAVENTPSVVVYIDLYDPGTDDYYNILESAAITGAGATVLKVHPDLTASPNLIVKDLLTQKFRIRVVHADADSITYSIGVNIVG